MIHQT